MKTLLSIALVLVTYTAHADITKLVCNASPDAIGYKFYIRFDDGNNFTENNARPIQPTCELDLATYVKADGQQKAVVAPVTPLGELENSNEVVIIKSGTSFTTIYPVKLTTQ